MGERERDLRRARATPTRGEREISEGLLEGAR